MADDSPHTASPTNLATGRRLWRARLLSFVLLTVGGILLLTALLYLASVRLNTWLLAQDRYLLVEAAGPLPPEGAVSTAELVFGSKAQPVSSASPPGPSPSQTPSPSASALPDPTSGAQPDSTSTPTALPTATPLPPAPVRIRIPAIGVDRSIIELPLTYDKRRRTWTRDLDQLLRTRGKDVVGHWGGSAYPGHAGNTILVGHNFGYGYNAVFIYLDRLKAGTQVRLVDAVGQTFSYRVTEVARVPWRRKDMQELAQHQAYLATDGPERLTLVTCGGAIWAPFPVRIYVVAELLR